MATQLSFTTEQTVSKEISTLQAESMPDILQWRNEKARTRVCFTLSFILLLSRPYSFFTSGSDGRDPRKNIANYFDTSNARDKISEKLLSIKGFVTLIAAFIQRGTGEAIATERVATKMENS